MYRRRVVYLVIVLWIKCQLLNVRLWYVVFVTNLIFGILTGWVTNALDIKKKSLSCK